MFPIWKQCQDIFQKSFTKLLVSRKLISRFCSLCKQNVDVIDKSIFIKVKLDEQKKPLSKHYNFFFAHVGMERHSSYKRE